MRLHEIKVTIKRKRRKRIGRGGKHGDYSGRGIKGQKARKGAKMRPGFEGGRTPLWRQLPKQKGFKSIYQKPVIVNIGDLEARFSDGEVIDPKILLEKGLVKEIKYGVKILGIGQITKKITLKGCLVSKSAKEKIEKAGGVVDLSDL